MKLWVLALLIFAFVALGGLVGVLAGRDPGYVLVTYDGQSIETSLWLALMLLAVLFAALLVVGIAALRLLQSRVALGRWSARRQREIAAERTRQGMLLFHEAEWSEAKRLLGGAGDDAPVPLLNYLCAARAAHALGDRSDRDRFLVAAERSADGAGFGVQLAQAEMFCDSGEWKAAKQLLEALRSRAPRHPRVLSLLAECYRAIGDWKSLAQLLPGLRKVRGIARSWIDRLTLDAARVQLAQLGTDEGAVRERQLLWKRLPRGVLSDPSLVLALVRCAERQGAVAEVSDAIVQAVNAALKTPEVATQASEPLQELVAIYSGISDLSVRERESTLRRWMDARETAGPVQLGLGRLRLLQGDAEGARELLEGVGDRTLATEQRTTRTAALELARLHIARGEASAAAATLERGFGHLRPVAFDSATMAPPPLTTDAASETVPVRAADSAAGPAAPASESEDDGAPVPQARGA
ncbi:MAG: heme biosynthesis HemY N-terminal domain-containing protein [Pseudomonadota bacterium]